MHGPKNGEAYTHIGDDLLQYDSLAVLRGFTVENLTKSTVIMTRGVVDKKYRGLGIFAKMSAFGEMVVLSEDCLYSIEVVDTNNTASKQALISLKYSSYGICQYFNGIQGELFYKVLK